MRNLTDDDVSAIAEALSQKTFDHACRFGRISQEDMEAAIQFYKNMNKILSESGSAARKTTVGIIVVLFAGALGLGFISKIRQAIGM